MILYVNGDSHSLGRMPSGLTGPGYIDLVADKLNLTVHNDADAAASVARVIRTTREYFLTERPNVFVLIGWGTWEREEWHHQGQYYSIMDNWYKHLPPELLDRYHTWAKTNSPEKLEQNAQAFHEQIYQLHKFLQESNIPHLFYNCMYNFFGVKPAEQKDWNNCYIGPYDNDASYYWYLKKQGYESDHWYHFGPDGHQAWADFLVNYINDHDLIR